MFVDGMVSIGASGFLSIGANGVYPTNIQATASVSGTIDTGGNFTATLTATRIDAGLNGGISLSANLSGTLSGSGVIAGPISGHLALTGTIDTNANLYLGTSGSLAGMAGLSFSGGITALVQTNGGFRAAGVALTVSGHGALGSISGTMTGTMANNVPAQITAPTYPTVTPLPGAPAVVQAPAIQGQTAQSVASVPPPVLPEINLDTNYPGWAIYLSGTNTPLVVPDQFRSIRFSRSAKVVSNPIENGSFASYNKIQEPATLSLIAVKNSSLADRQAFETALLAAQGTLNLYTVSIPENAYINLTLERVEPGKRGGDQAYSSEIELFFREVLQFSSTYGDMQNAQATTAAPSVSSGSLVALPAPASAANLVPVSP